MIMTPQCRTATYHSHVLIVIVLLIAPLVTGCTAIRSSSVEALVLEQGEKIETASAYSEEFVSQDHKRRTAYRSAVDDLNSAMISIQIAETQMALAMASKRALENLSGPDAEAFAYMSGRLYWSEHAGLGALVYQQFEDDFDGLNLLARELRGSWASLDTLSNQVELYSQKNGFLRGVDPGFIAALINQSSIESHVIDDLLRKSKSVNNALRKASGLNFIDTADATDLASFSYDLIKLLELIGSQNGDTNE